MDVIIQAMSGIMQVTGEPGGPPTRVGVPIGDMVASLYAANGIMAALWVRQRTGRGQHIDISLLDSLQTHALNLLTDQVPTHVAPEAHWLLAPRFSVGTESKERCEPRRGAAKKAR